MAIPHPLLTCPLYISVIYCILKDIRFTSLAKCLQDAKYVFLGRLVYFCLCIYEIIRSTCVVFLLLHIFTLFWLGSGCWDPVKKSWIFFIFLFFLLRTMVPLCILKMYINISPLRKIAKRTNKTSLCWNYSCQLLYSENKIYKFKRSAKCLTMKSILFNQFFISLYIKSIIYILSLYVLYSSKEQKWYNTKQKKNLFSQRRQEMKSRSIFYCCFFLKRRLS